jgi:hypothetical protein
MSSEATRDAGAAKLLRGPIDPVVLLEEVEGCLRSTRMPV